MRVSFPIYAGRDTRFTESAARQLVGRHVPLNMRDTEAGPITQALGMCTVVGAELLEGGAAIMITVEPDELTLHHPIGS